MSNIKIKVWDWPIRLFHWLLVASIIFQFISGDILDDAMQWHFYAGYFCIGLLVFRVLWGIFGTHYARFNQFIRSPFKVFSYLSGQDKQSYLGHNPAGAYSVVVMLTLVLSQAVSGLFMTDDIFSEGPYYAAVSEQWQDFSSFIHHNAINLIWAMIALHIVSILYYQFKKKQKLTQAMITGYKTTETEHKIKNNMGIVQLSVRLAVCILTSALLVYLAIEVLPPESVQDFYY